MLRTRLLVLVVLALLPAAAWPQGNPLGPEFRVNTYTTGNQFGYSVAVDDSGNFVVVWSSDALQDGSLFSVVAQRYDSSGTPLGSEFRINTYTTGYQFGSVVASDAAGNFVVVWTSDNQDGSGVGLFGQRFASGGASLGPEFRVNTYTTGNQYAPSVAATPAGDFVVVWQSYWQDGFLAGVFGQRYAASGAPLGAEFRVNTSTTRHEYNPAVAIDPAGNFVVVWQNEGAGGGGGGPPPGVGVFGQRYAASGVPLGSEFRVNSYTTGGQVYPAVVVQPSGGFVVAWASTAQDGSAFGVFGQRYDGAGGPLGPEFRVNTFTTSSQVGPAVASDSSGNFVVVWESYLQDGSGFGVFGQRYVTSGAPLGPEFRVNTFTTGFQRVPSVAADTAGNFLVIWNSNLQDGSGWGVFGQRYAQIVPVELMRFGVE